MTDKKKEASLIGFFKDTIGTLFSYAYGKENRLTMSAVHVLGFMEASVQILTPLCIIDFLKQTTDKQQHVPPNNTSLYLGIAGIVINLALPRVRNILIDTVKSNIQQSITRDMVEKIYDGELNELMGQPTGKPAALVSKNYGSVQNVVPIFVTDLLQATIETFGISVVLSHQFGKIGAVPALILTPYLLGAVLGEVYSLMLKINNQGIMVESFGTLLQVINNYTIAHQYGNRNLELTKLNTALSKLDKSFNKVHKAEEAVAVILASIAQLSLFGSLAYVYFCPPQPEFWSKNFLLFGYYMLRSNTLLATLPRKINDLFTGLADTHLIVDFFKNETTVPDPTTPIKLTLNSAPKIEFKNVSFSYGEGRNGIHNISFTLEPGQKIAIMGTTGSGKSTLLKLLQRFYEFSGEIFINDIEIKQIRKEDLRRYFSVVSQETSLVTNTLFDSIKYADSTASEDDVLTAAKYAKLTLARDRFFTPIQQDGSNFSGGEKQRTNIARALLKRNAWTFLLDEPTSSLDQQTAKDICEVLDKLASNTTTIMVTHDPNAVIHVDRILYMQDGKIIEEGTFNDLMNKKGAFYEQFLIQCKKLGISPEDVKPMKYATSMEVSEFSQWRNNRNHA